MSDAYTTAEIKDIQERFNSLAREHEQLVQTVLDGIVIAQEMEVPGVVLNLLLQEARDGFEAAARKLIGGDLDLYSDKGLSETRKAYSDVTRYREMIDTIMRALMQAKDAAEDTSSVENMMRNFD